jgi:ABC-type multidrug transport system permease subunit
MPLDAVGRRRRADLQLRRAGPHRHRRAAAGPGRAGIAFKDLHTTQSSLEDIFVGLVHEGARTHEPARRPRHLPFEMARTWRTLMQSIVSPVMSTSLYFVVFGAAIGSRIPEVDGVSYGAFIVPGLVMLSLLTQSISNASFGIYFPEVHGHHLRAAVGAGLHVEIVLAYVGAAATKSIMLGLIILATAALFVPLRDRCTRCGCWPSWC